MVFSAQSMSMAAYATMEYVTPSLQRREARIETDQEQIEAEIKTGLVEVEATDLEANPKEIKSVMKRSQCKVSEPLEDQYGDQHLALGRRRHWKKRTQSDGGSRQKLAAARRRLTRRGYRGPGKTTGNGIRGRSRRLELRLGSKKTLYVKRGVAISIGLREMSDWTLWPRTQHWNTSCPRQATIALQHRNGVFFDFHAEVL
jgi:hypothetical protein